VAYKGLGNHREHRDVLAQAFLVKPTSGLLVGKVGREGGVATAGYRQGRFAKQGREGALVLGDPGLEVVEAVVALRE
jgi:hypothetical protein